MRILVTEDTDWLLRFPGQQHHLIDRLTIVGHEVRVIDYEISLLDEFKETPYRKGFRLNNVSRTVEGASVELLRPSAIQVPFVHYLIAFIQYDRLIRNQIATFEPDVIIGHSILTNYLSLKWASKKAIPFVFHMTDAQHTIVPRWYLKPIAKIIESYILRHANRVVVINDKLRDYAISMGCDPSKVTVVKAGVDLRRYDPTVDGLAIRRKFGISPHSIVLFFMGWLYRFSGLTEVLSEIGRTKDDRIVLLIVGDGEAYADLVRMRARENLEKRIILTGRMPYPDIPELIASSDVCILPALNNDTMKDIVPIKMYEYMAMGRPVISTNLDGVRREFGEGNGVTYVDKPENTVAAAIRMADLETIRQEGRKARMFVEGRDWTVVVREFEDILKELANSTVSKQRTLR